MKATLVAKRKETLPSGVTVEITIWRLPAPTPDRPHGFKYRLWAGRGGTTLVRYDNERGKGDHRHERGREFPYRFSSLAGLIEDFLADVGRLGG